jgi:cystathionine gamma-synthase
MNPKKDLHIETKAVHSGQPPDPATGALVPPIHLATTFERDPDLSYPKGFSYSRSNNPNRQALETCAADVEGAAHAIAFSSGIGAANAILTALQPSDHLVITKDVYHGVRTSVHHLIELGRLQATFIDATNLENIAKAIQSNTKLLWLETPSNPLLTITDLAGAAEIAGNKGILTICDGTFATPILQHPLDLGIDMVMHSTTKYFAGHSDVTGGLLLANQQNPLFTEAQLSQQLGIGGIPSPFDCWLTLRGMATMPLRVRAQCESAMQIATFLSQHPNIEHVFYPGLLTHPQHNLAARQMKMFGAVLSFQLLGSKEDALRVAAGVRIFTRATSLGGTHSLIEHRASVEGPLTETPQNLLRLSIGLEHPDDLIEDLLTALQPA